MHINILILICNWQYYELLKHFIFICFFRWLPATEDVWSSYKPVWMSDHKLQNRCQTAVASPGWDICTGKLMLSTLGKIFNGQHFRIFFFLFSQETGFDISCKLSPSLHEMSILFSGKIRKKKLKKKKKKKNSLQAKKKNSLQAMSNPVFWEKKTKKQQKTTTKKQKTTTKKQQH